MMKIFLPRKFLLVFVFLASVLFPFNDALVTAAPPPLMLENTYSFSANFDANYYQSGQVIYTSPLLQGMKDYDSPVSIVINATMGNYVRGVSYYASVVVEGTKDDKNWFRIAYASASGVGEESKNVITESYPITTFKRFRIVYSGGAYGTYTSGSITITSYDFVASQRSVNETRDAAIQARDNTQAAVDAARQARQAAENVNTIVNSTLTVSAGVVQDASGTVLTAARAAQMAAQANSQKLDDISNTLSQVQNNIQKVQQSVQNITQNMPPILNSVSGLNGANATSSGSLQVVIDASNASVYRYRIDSGSWSAWQPYAETVSIPIPRGVHTLTIQVANLDEKGNPGPTAQKSMQVIGL